MSNPLLDKDFLLKLDKQRNRKTYARIIVLDLEEKPIEQIEVQDLVALNDNFGVEITDANKAEYGVYDFNEDGIIDKKDRNILKAMADCAEERLKADGMEKLYSEVEIPLINVLADIEKQGFRVDSKILTEQGAEIDATIENDKKDIFSLSGHEFNINSPKQLGTVLFEELGLKTGKKTKSGYSTGQEVLESLALEHPIIPLIMEYRQNTKLKSTYIDGLLNVINPETQRVYSCFNQTVTATGRLSSTEPNLQNIPTRHELGRLIRKAFFASEKGRVLVDADYSQIELRVLAHMSGDEELINAYKTDQDIHKITASKVFNTPLEEVTPLQRRNAKAVNFGIVYGISEFSLADDIGVSRYEAKEYIESYLANYPGVRDYLENTKKSSKM